MHFTKLVSAKRTTLGSLAASPRGNLHPLTQMQANSQAPPRSGTDVCHIVESIDPQYGGPSLVALALAAAQQTRTNRVVLVTQSEPGRESVIRQFIADEVGEAGPLIRMLPVSGRLERRISPRIAAVVLSRLPRDGVLHLHGLWTSGNVWASLACWRDKVPFVLRPAGCLEPWSMTQKPFRKKAAMALLFRRILNSAGALHATSLQEARHFRDLGLKGPIAVIANGVQLNDQNQQESRTRIERSWPATAGKKRLLFLSRIHKKKGLLLLAEAWRMLRHQCPEWHIVIAGPDQDGHQKAVQAAFASFDAARDVTFTGPVNGELKQQLYRACDLFVLPTHSENFGIVVAEALAARLPVVTTKGTPWTMLPERGCGWCIELAVPALAETLHQALSLSDREREDMGSRGREFVEDEFSWSAIATQTESLYQWLRGRATRPDFVLFDKN